MAVAASACRPQIVHAHDLNTLGVGRRVAQAAAARLVYDAHELHTARNDATPLSRLVARARERRGVRVADAVITATGTWADMMARSYGIPRPAVVRNMPPRTPVEASVDLRARLGIASEATILLYQGSIQTNRGIEQTIAALPGLPDCLLVICGYGAHRPALEERVAAAGLGHRVRFDGPVPNGELIAYSAGADIGLCLIIGSSESYRTSLPNKLFEYLMAGIPVVASDFPEMGAVVRRTGAGETCDPTDPGAIAAAVDRLRDPDRYADARDKAIAAARELHWDSEEQVLLALYEGLSATRR
jgi:glycosyltransferase involved in cell wall biosynthesis